MFIRPCYREKDGKRHAYWALVESYRTARGPRQRVVAYLGELTEPEAAFRIEKNDLVIQPIWHQKQRAECRGPRGTEIQTTDRKAEGKD